MYTEDIVGTATVQKNQIVWFTMKEGSRRQNAHINLVKKLFNPAIPTFENCR